MTQEPKKKQKIERARSRIPSVIGVATMLNYSLNTDNTRPGRSYTVIPEPTTVVTML